VAGTNISVDYDDKQVQDALNRLLAVTENTRSVMMEISEYFHRRTRENFDNQQDADGNAWAPLKDSTEKRKAAMGVPVNKILHGQTLHLRDTIFPFFSDTEAGVSTGPGTEDYAAAMQYGTEGMNIQVPGHQRLISQAFGHELAYPVWANIPAFSFTGNTPARPYLGVSKSDEEEVLDILEEEILSFR